MNADDLPDLPTAEGVQVEFRRSADTKPIAHTVSAFLNGDGGLVMVGFDDAGGFVGLSGDANAFLDTLRQDIERAIVPREPLQITPVEQGPLTAFLVEVPRGARPPYLADGTIYVRSGGATRTATPADVSRVVAQRSTAETRWERQPVLDIKANAFESGDLDAPLVHAAYRGALERLHIPVTPDNRLLTFLDALGLTAEGSPSRAALALFATPKAVPRYIPQARAQIIAFTADSAEEPLTRRELAGGAAVLAQSLFETAALELPRVLALPATGVRRDDRLAIPTSALREALVNALAHRDYTDPGFVSVRSFPDRVEVWNPGKMDRAFLTGDDARLVSRPVNPDVARIFNLLGYAEGTGIGLWRIRDAMKRAGLPSPTWQNQTGGVLLTLPTTDAPPAGSVDLAPRLAAFVEQAPPGTEITRAEYRRAFAPNVSERTAVNDVQSLVDEGFLRQRGAGRNTRYVRTAKTAAPMD